MQHAIDRLRRFERSVTQRIGLLEDRFLGIDRPLAENRLMFEIGDAGADVKELRRRLGLDSGYLSRLLRSLEGQGLVTTGAKPEDRRARVVTLTDAGAAEVVRMSGLADDAARSLLEPLSESQRGKLVDAMERVERLLTVPFVRVEPSDPESDAVRSCLAHYFADLTPRFGETVTPEGHALDRASFVPPRGVFLVARLDGRSVGCGALTTLDDGVGYITRMWVSGDVRGIGLGARLLEELEEHARRLGHRLVRLYTHRNLSEAQGLYRSRGYREVAPFLDDAPFADHFFEKEL